MTPSELAASSRSALDRALAAPAELLVEVPSEEAIVYGAFQSDMPGLHRGSGGGAARVGPGSVWIQLALSRVDALVPCDANRLLNRYVRPLLRALTKVSGTPAHYFGRDWVSVAHRPAAMVAFAHDAGSGRALFEAIVAAREPFADGKRASFMGKEPTTLERDPAVVASAIRTAYEAIGARAGAGAEAGAGAGAGAGAWAAVREEAIGIIGATPASLGGEFMASRDAVAELAAKLATTSDEDVGAAVDAAFAPPRVIFGVKSLTSMRDAILDARRAARVTE